MKKVDLHCHSEVSDGDFSPKMLIDMALAQGCQGLSITDHDAVDGFDEGKAYAEHMQFLWIPGVEISTIWRSATVHVLGYGCDPEVLVPVCAVQQERRLRRVVAMLEKLSTMHKIVTIESLQALFPKTRSFGRKHIAKALVVSEQARDMRECFGLYLGNGKPCYVEGELWRVEEAVATIHQAGGLAILAHPQHLTKKTVSSLLRLDGDARFDGIEGYYARSLSYSYWCQIAQDRNLLVTGGSDFHGQESSPLGCSWTPEESLEKICRHVGL